MGLNGCRRGIDEIEVIQGLEEALRGLRRIKGV
jgi:hypothetical protein